MFRVIAAERYQPSWLKVEATGASPSIQIPSAASSRRASSGSGTNVGRREKRFNTVRLLGRRRARASERRRWRATHRLLHDGSTANERDQLNGITPHPRRSRAGNLDAHHRSKTCAAK
jgi:hypothetical protein